MESFTFDNLPIAETSNLYDLFIRTIHKTVIYKNTL